MAAFALLLALGGATKVGQPDNTVRALRGLGVPATAVVVRILALAEIAIGIAAVAVGGWVPALLMAISYAGFSAFVVMAMVRGGPLSSCGCFGTPDTPPTPIHLIVTAAAAGVAAAGAVAPVGPLLDHLGHSPAHGVPFALLTGVSVWFAYAALAILPKTVTPNTVTPNTVTPNIVTPNIVAPNTGTSA